MMSVEPDDAAHEPGTRRGEELPDGQEPGRVETGSNEASRDTGVSTGRFATGINPEFEEPIDAESPDLPPA